MVKRFTKGSFRSKFERTIWNDLIKEFPEATYEQDTLEYTKPATKHKYTPDFSTGVPDVYLEAKGMLDLETRKKMIAFRESNPFTIIIFLFMNSSVPIRKGSKTTYGDWAKKNDFHYLDARHDWIKGYNDIIKELYE